MAVDLDGTLLRSDLSVSARTRAALRAVEAAGVLLVFVTGRPPRWIHPVADQTDHRGVAVCANGALLYDLHTRRLLAADLIAPELLGEAVRRLRTALPALAFAVEYGAAFAHEAAYPVFEQQLRPDVRLVDSALLVGEPAAKLLVRHPDLPSAVLLPLAQELLDGMVEATHSTPDGPGLLEISAPGVDKAAALARLCARHGIDAAEVIAFGDMPNDVPMLTWAGRAYAMANAHADVLARVVARAPSNDLDGVAVILEDLFGNP